MKPSNKELGPDDYNGYITPHPLLDRGSPEAEAMKWRAVPWLWKSQRQNDSYLATVKYYDRPDGEDLLGKLVAINRTVYPYCVVSGLMMGLMEQRTTNLAMAFTRGWHYFWPGFAVASTFAGVSYISHNLRKKDDVVNYWAGAIGAAYIIGHWRRSHIIGWGVAVPFLFAAGIQHQNHKLGWKWWNFEENLMGGHSWHKFGWDFFEDTTPKGYTTSTE